MGHRVPFRVAALALVLVNAAACGVTLVAPYDLPSDLMATALAVKVEAVLDALDADPVPAYGRGPYRELRADLRVLRDRNAARQRNARTVAQLDALAAILDSLEADHRDGQLPRALVEPTRATLGETFRAIFRLEQEKRRAAP